MNFTHIANPVRVTAIQIRDVIMLVGARFELTLADGCTYIADQKMTARYIPQTGDYLVTGEDGYQYLNPKDVFERKYSPAAIPAASHPPVTTLSNNDSQENEIQARGLTTAPRITLDHIRSVIRSEVYFTAAQAAEAAGFKPDPSLELMTFCLLVLKNGFVTSGKSAVASPENFDPAMGRKVARDKAISKLWMLEGYLLKEHLHLLKQIEAGHFASEAPGAEQA